MKTRDFSSRVRYTRPSAFLKEKTIMTVIPEISIKRPYFVFASCFSLSKNILRFALTEETLPEFLTLTLSANLVKWSNTLKKNVGNNNFTRLAL